MANLGLTPWTLVWDFWDHPFGLGSKEECLALATNRDKDWWARDVNRAQLLPVSCLLDQKATMASPDASARLSVPDSWCHYEARCPGVGGRRGRNVLYCSYWCTQWFWITVEVARREEEWMIVPEPATKPSLQPLHLLFPVVCFALVTPTSPLEEILCNIPFGSVDVEESRTRNLRCVLYEFWFEILCLLN